MSKIGQFHLILMCFIFSKICLADKNFDSGFLIGLNTVDGMISNYTEGAGNIDYHMRTFEIRRNLANAIARRIQTQVPRIENKLLAQALSELAKDILSSPQKGNGNVRYWVEMLKLQNNVLDRVNVKLKNLNALINANQFISSQKEIGLLEGIMVGVEASSEFPNGAGKIEYHLRTFELKREMANELAYNIQKLLPRMENKLLAHALSELAEDIFSAPQSGRGDIDFWLETLRQQNRILVRVKEKFTTLISTFSKTDIKNDCLSLFDR